MIEMACDNLGIREVPETLICGGGFDDVHGADFEGHWVWWVVRIPPLETIIMARGSMVVGSGIGFVANF